MKLSLSQIHEHVQPARAIDDRSIRVAISVQISPGKTVDAGNSGKGMNGQKGAVAVISQDCRNALFGAEYEVEVAIRFDIHRPRSAVVSVHYRAW